MNPQTRKNIRPFVELFAALFLSFILIFGAIYTFSKLFWDYRKDTVKTRAQKSLSWWLSSIVQVVIVATFLIYHVIYSMGYLFTLRIWGFLKYLAHHIAKAIDKLGNVLAGEMIEDIITPIEKTYFGLGEFTISASTGYLVALHKKNINALNPRGIWFSNALNKVFDEEQHCLSAYWNEIAKHPIFGKSDFLINYK